MGGAGDLSSQDTRVAIKLQQSLSSQPSEPQAPLSKKERLQRFPGSLKKRLTCACSKGTYRFLALAVSLWQLADNISDGWSTYKYLHYAEVSIRHLRSYYGLVRNQPPMRIVITREIVIIAKDGRVKLLPFSLHTGHPQMQ